MPRICIVRNCHATDELASFRSYYKLPSSERTLQHRKQWLKALKISELPENNNYFVCDRHFESQFIGIRGLLKHAVPTLYLNIGESLTGYEDSQQHGNHYDFRDENLEIDNFKKSETVKITVPVSSNIKF